MDSKINAGGLRVVDALAAGNRISPELLTIAHICPYCLGSGKQKAMQMGLDYCGRTVRVADTKVKCTVCKGKGFLT